MRACALLAVALLLATSAYCDTVTVSPDNMQGWDVEINKWGLAYFTSCGCVWDETGAGFPSGRGAFYAMTTGGEGNTPDSVWLGMDTLNGQPLAGVTLNQIKTLQYTCYVSDMPNYKVGSAGENEWKYPREPICLQFVVQDSVGNRRNIWFRPWSSKPEGGGYGGNPADQMGQWITYDCIACTPQFTGWIKTITPMWNEPIINNQYNSWADLCTVYGDYTLVATAAEGTTYHSAGWDNNTSPPGATTATATGMPLNFEVGARKSQYKDIWGATTGKNWIPESCWFKGYVDTFTIGVDFNSDGDDADQGEQTTYDFEPAATAQEPELVALNMRSICEGQTLTDFSTGPRTGYAAIWESSNLWKFFRTRLFGQVKLLPAPVQAEEGGFSEDGNTVTCTYFDITDGSSGIPVPITVRVRDDDGIIYNKVMWGGEFVGVSGDVRRKPWGLTKMRYVWSCAGNVEDYTYIPPPP